LFETCGIYYFKSTNSGIRKVGICFAATAVSHLIVIVFLAIPEFVWNQPLSQLCQSQ
jgi:hypothetical protein